MGFQEKQQIYRLEFDGEYEGLEVKTTLPPMGVVLDLQDAGFDLAHLVGKDASALTEADVEKVQAASKDVIDAFLEHLVDWNIDDAQGERIPANEAGLRRISSNLGRHILETWQQFVTGELDNPKEQSSSSGKPSLEASLPMEPLSPSRAS